MSNNSTALKTVLFSILGNTILAAIKFLAGFFGNSYALIADAIESTSDIFASILVFLGIKVSSKPADENHPYGHGRLEPLVTFAVVGFLLISASIIFFESIENIRTPHELPKPFTLIVLVAIIIFKELSYRFVNKKGEEVHSSSLKADAWHHRSDAITSLTAFIGISIALIMGKGWESADDWAAIIAALFIAYNAYKIFRPALGEIMDEQLYGEMEEDIRILGEKIPDIFLIEKCYIRKVGMMFFIDIHIMVDANKTVSEGHSIGHLLKDEIISKFPEVKDVLVHVEPDVCEWKD